MKMALTKPNVAVTENENETEVEQASEAVQTEQAVQAQPYTEVAVASEASANLPATTGNANASAALVALRAAGHDDLDLGYGAFPNIKLPGQLFESSEEHNLGDGFDFVIAEKKTKYLYKGVNPEDKEDEKVVYSYDRSTTTCGVMVEDVMAEWKEKGWKTECKKYFDVVVVVKSGVLKGRICILSLPPTALTTYSGYVVGNQMTYKKTPQEYVSRALVGKKVTTSVKPFWPWAFEIVDDLEGYEASNS